VSLHFTLLCFSLQGELVDLQSRVSAQEEQNSDLLRRLKAAQRALKTRDVNSRNNMLVRCVVQLYPCRAAVVGSAERL
jgi:cell division protein FtsL